MQAHQLKMQSIGRGTRIQHFLKNLRFLNGPSSFNPQENKRDERPSLHNIRWGERPSLHNMLLVQRGFPPDSDSQGKPRTPVFNQDWQILIKVAAYKNRTRRCGYAFEARNMECILLFRGGSS